MIIDHVSTCACRLSLVTGARPMMDTKLIDARCIAAYVTPGHSDPAGESVNDGDPWADVMPAPLCAYDCDHAEHQPNPVLAPQFHPDPAVERGGFDPNADPYSEAEWRAAAAPLTPIAQFPMVPANSSLANVAQPPPCPAHVADGNRLDCPSCGAVRKGFYLRLAGDV
jgi:hypothetical protein